MTKEDQETFDHLSTGQSSIPMPQCTRGTERTFVQKVPSNFCTNVPLFTNLNPMGFLHESNAGKDISPEESYHYFVFRFSFHMFVNVYISLRGWERDAPGVKLFFDRLDDVEINVPVIGTLDPCSGLENHFPVGQFLDENRGLRVLEDPHVFVEDVLYALSYIVNIFAVAHAKIEIDPPGLLLGVINDVIPHDLGVRDNDHLVVQCIECRREHLDFLNNAAAPAPSM